MRWPRESLSLAGRSGSNPDPGVNVKDLTEMCGGMYTAESNCSISCDKF